MSVGNQSGKYEGTSVSDAGLTWPGHFTIHGNADSAFVATAFESFQTSGGLKKSACRPAHVKTLVATRMRRTVIRREDNDRVFRQAVFLEASDNRADVLVQVRDHSGIGRAGSGVRQVTVLAAIDSVLFVPFRRIAVDPFLRRLHRQMRFHKRQIEKKSIGLVPVDKLDSLFQDQIGRIVFGSVIVCADFDLLVFGRCREWGSC